MSWKLGFLVLALVALCHSKEYICDSDGTTFSYNNGCEMISCPCLNPMTGCSEPEEPCGKSKLKRNSNILKFSAKLACCNMRVRPSGGTFMAMGQSFQEMSPMKPLETID